MGRTVRDAPGTNALGQFIGRVNGTHVNVAALLFAALALRVRWFDAARRDWIRMILEGWQVHYGVWIEVPNSATLPAESVDGKCWAHPAFS
jgi:hypothetical protein